VGASAPPKLYLPKICFVLVAESNIDKNRNVSQDLLGGGIGILPPAQYWVRNTDHSAPHYVTFSIPLFTSSLLSPNTLLNTKFSNTLSLCSSLNVSEEVSHPYKNNGQNYVVFQCHHMSLMDFVVSLLVVAKV
jgi:hypothetical protein